MRGGYFLNDTPGSCSQCNEYLGQLLKKKNYKANAYTTGGTIGSIQN